MLASVGGWAVHLGNEIETTAICVIDDILDCLSARRSPCVQDRETAPTEQRNHFRLEQGGFYRCAYSRSSLSPWPDWLRCRRSLRPRRRTAHRPASAAPSRSSTTTI